MDLKRKIEQYAEPFLSRVGAFVIDVQIINEGRKSIVQLFVDTDTGITIDQCAEISRQLGKTLELENVFQGAYELQVSSPGLKKPLKLLRQYKKNIDRIYKVRFRKNGEIEEMSGRLLSVEGEILTFRSDSCGDFAIPFGEVVESIEELPW